MPQPYDYTIRPTGQSPIRTASGLIGLQQNYQQQQQQQAEQQRQAQFRMGLQQLDPNDPAAAQALAQQYPGQIEQIQGFQGFANEQQQMQVRDAAGGMITAAQSGDPELLQQTIDQYAPVISGTGNPSITPEVLKRIAKNKPETFLQMMKGSYGRAGGDLEQLGIAEPLTAFQSAQIDQKKEANRIAGLESKRKIAEQKVKTEKDAKALEKQDLEIEKLDNEILTSKRTVFDAGTDNIDSITDTMNKIEEIRNHPGMSMALGLTQYVPLSKEAADFKALVEGMQGDAFLQAVRALGTASGMTEVEGAKAQAAINSINFDMSEKGFNNQLDKFEGFLGKARGKAFERLPEAPEGRQAYDLPATAREIREQEEVIQKEEDRKILDQRRAERQQQFRDRGKYQAAPTIPNVGAVIDGHEFLGGNPANPNSWRKI